VPRAGFTRAILLTCLLFSAAPAGRAQDGSIWNDREGFRYTNRKAMQIGDLITVIVTESASGSNRSSLSTSKEHKVDIEGGPGAGPFDFIPLFNLESNAKNELDGSGQVSVSGQLSTTLTVQVREIRPDGCLLVEGSRYIELNGEDEQVTLSGVARPEDIRSDNTILSTRLAEVMIHYTGKGAGKSASRPGILQRVLSWIF
jgi:flagellar L-ring protein precursor FlgH